MSALTIERLEGLEAAGTLTDDLRTELSRLRKERDLERQLAEAEEAAKKPKRPDPVVLPEEPQAADDVLIVQVSRQGMFTDIVNTIDGQDYRLNHLATCFIPHKLWNHKLFYRRFHHEIGDSLIVHEDWHARLFDPRRLVSNGRGAPQEVQHLISTVRSPLIAHLWQSSLQADGQRTRKLDDLLARHGIVRPAPLTGDNAWDIFTKKRAAGEKAKAEELTKRSKVEAQQRKHIEAAERQESARIAAKRAAQEAYQKALADIENEKTKTSTKRKSA